MFLKRLLLPICILSTIVLSANDKYPAFAMDSADIKAVLAQAFVYQPNRSTATLPADITFGCADIKYNQGTFKIVECGDGIYMSLRTNDVIMNNKQYRLVAPYWGLFWHYLAQFGLPIWHIQDGGPTNALAQEKLKQLGGKYAYSWQHLENDKLFQKTAKRKIAQSNHINDYAGIIVYRARQEKNRETSSTEYKLFKAKHPNFIYVNAHTRNILKRKDNTYQLFTDAGLEEYIPLSKTLSSEYSPLLAKTIIQALGNPKQYIIKPVYSSLSMGVNAVAPHDLDALLELILKNKQAIPSNAPRSLSYWKRLSPAYFVASEYVQSHTIYKDGNPYDPTMRVMFAMHHEQGIIQVNVLGGFWKIPVKSLNQKTATLTQRHVTIAHAGDYYSGIMVDPADAAVLKKSLAPVLAKAYEQMLQTTKYR